MPECIVPAERMPHLVREVLHAGARCQDMITLARLRCVPLASILCDDVIEEDTEDIIGKGLVRIVHVEGGAEVEGLAFALCDPGEDGAEIDAAGARCAVVNEKVDGWDREG